MTEVKMTETKHINPCPCCGKNSLKKIPGWDDAGVSVHMDRMSENCIISFYECEDCNTRFCMIQKDKQTPKYAFGGILDSSWCNKFGAKINYVHEHKTCTENCGVEINGRVKLCSHCELLVELCPRCDRKLMKGICRVHGIIKGDK